MCRFLTDQVFNENNNSIERSACVRLISATATNTAFTQPVAIHVMHQPARQLVYCSTTLLLSMIVVVVPTCSQSMALDREEALLTVVVQTLWLAFLLFLPSNNLQFSHRFCRRRLPKCCLDDHCGEIWIAQMFIIRLLQRAWEPYQMLEV